MKNRRPRKYRLKYLGRIKDKDNKGGYHRQMRSYPCLPTEEFLAEHNNVFPINELKINGELD